jgi:hypothetical protein
MPDYRITSQIPPQTIYVTTHPFEAVRVWSLDGDVSAILTDGTQYAIGRYPHVEAGRKTWRQTSPEELEATAQYQAEALAAERRIMEQPRREEPN